MSERDLRHLFVSPALKAQTGKRLVVEPRAMTPAGTVVSEGARVQSALELYRRRRQLSWRQCEAGQRLYRSYALGVIGARNGEGGSAAWTPSGYADAQLNALHDYRHALAQIPPRMRPLVEQVCCEDQSIDRIGREEALSVTGLMCLLRFCLDTLADWYLLDDQP
jgi:Domain of unknown function (DUF6456)